MNQRYALTLAVSLLAANLAFGQAAPPAARETLSMPTEVVGSGEESPLLVAPVAGPSTAGGSISARADYVLWFLAGSKGTVPITTLFPGQSPLTQLGDAEEHSLLGSGGRLALGYWVTDDNAWVPQGIRECGAEVAFLVVGRREGDASTDTPSTLFRPFFDLNNRVESGFLVASPGIATGGVNAHAYVEFWGAETNLWKNVYYDKPGTTCAVDLMAGFRYLNSNSALDINSVSSFNPTIAAASPFAPFAGNQLNVNDSFTAHNNFYGGQVGISVKTFPDESNLTFEGSFRIALGTTSEDLSISGSQVRTFANGTTAFSNGGLLALPSNIGSYHHNVFAQIPEAGFKIAYALGRHLELSAGFSALYWSKILRPSGQIDRSIDITQIPNDPLTAGATPTGLNRPSVPFLQSDAWLLGITLGAEYKW